jgi:CBS domain-containing protein
MSLTAYSKSRDDTVLHLARTMISDKRPRRTTGEVWIWKEGNVATVRKSEPISRVMKKLVTENFLSAPVLDESGLYCGVVDMLDLVKYITGLFAGETSSAWTDYFAKQTLFKEAIVADVIKSKMASKRFDPTDVYHTLEEGYSLLHAFEVLARTGCHRVPVINSGKIVGIYSNSMAISHIKQNLSILGEIGSMKVADMCQSYDVKTIVESKSAIDAFNLMVETGVSGLAVTDNQGILVDTISIRDLRGLGCEGDQFASLFSNTVTDFKVLSRKVHPTQASSTHYSNRRLPKSALYATPTQTFRDVISMLNDGNIHRVFVCSDSSDAAGAPRAIGVISQTDVIKTVLHACGTLQRL